MSEAGMDNTTDPETAAKEAVLREHIQRTVRAFETSSEKGIPKGIPSQHRRFYLFRQRRLYAEEHLPSDHGLTREEIARSILEMTGETNILKNPTARRIIVGK